METKLYELTPPQDLFCEFMKFSLYKNEMTLPLIFTVSEKLDFDLFERAFQLEIERNDALRMRITKKNGKYYQYFLREYRCAPIERLDFTGLSAGEQRERLSRIAAKPLNLKKHENYRVKLFRGFDGRSGVYFGFFHVTMDAYGVMAMLSDLLGVYLALRDGGELPEPPGSCEEQLPRLLQAPDEDAHRRIVELYEKLLFGDGEPFLAGVQGRGFLEGLPKRKKSPSGRGALLLDPFRQSCGVVERRVSAERMADIEALADRLSVPAHLVLQLAMRLYLMKLNREYDVVIMQTLANRPLLADKRVGGSRATAVPFRTVFSGSMTFAEAAESANKTLNSVYRCGRLELKDILGGAKKHLDGKVYIYEASYFNWIPAFFTPPAELEADVEWVNPGKYSGFLYTMCIPCLTGGGIKMYCEYRKLYIKLAEVEALMDGMERVLDAALENADIPLGELMEALTI